MFGKRLKRAFLLVKNDIEGLKSNANDWIIYLNSNQRKLKTRVAELERKLAKLEKEDLIRVY